jgi:hypothetical protein
MENLITISLTEEEINLIKHCLNLWMLRFFDKKVIPYQPKEPTYIEYKINKALREQ